MFELKGHIKVIFDTQKISEKFQKREFVINDTSGPYPQDILFQLTQDRVGLVDDYNKGDQVNVAFNIRGREWTNKEGKTMYFNSLDVWKIDAIGEPKEKGANLPPLPEQAPDDTLDEDPGDLPF